MIIRENSILWIIDPETGEKLRQADIQSILYEILLEMRREK